MALVIYWYDFICFAIVAASVSVALWFLKQREGGGDGYDKSKYESLLVSGSTEADDCAGVAKPGYVSSSQLWTSCWRGVHPVWLLALRVVSVIVMSGFLAWDVVLWDASIFVYYTEWTFALTILYFVLATIVSLHGCMEYCSDSSNIENSERNGYLEERRSTTTLNFITFKLKDIIKVQNHQEDIERKAGFWGYLMQTVFQTCAGAVVVTDLVFWCVIVPFLSIAHFKLNMLMGCMHSLNAVFLLLDTALNNLSFPWFRFGYFVLWSCVYVIYQWILHACGFSWWPYPFLELNTPWAPLWYFCLAVIHIPCYGLFSLIERAKYSLLPKWFPNAFVRSY